jgi:RsiW-degrading membrane proteinase PrsW (M82 family)
MIDALILFVSVIVGLLLLRSLGGKDLNIKFQLASISTSKGKRDHIIVWIALSIMSMGIAFYFTRQNNADTSSLLVIPFILGALVGLLPYLRNRR